VPASCTPSPRHDRCEVALLLTERAQHQALLAAVEGLSEATHPYELTTGQARRGEVVEAELHERLDEAEAVADEAALSHASHKGIGKARRAVAAMAATVEAFHGRMTPSCRRWVCRRRSRRPCASGDEMGGRALQRSRSRRLVMPNDTRAPLRCRSPGRPQPSRGGAGGVNSTDQAVSRSNAVVSMTLSPSVTTSARV
jgi:hypothetical protein